MFTRIAAIRAHLSKGISGFQDRFLLADCLQTPSQSGNTRMVTWMPTRPVYKQTFLR